MEGYVCLATFLSLLRPILMTTQVDEETPLLQESNGNRRPTPVPWFQFSLVLFLQLTEPLTSQVIYPFAPQVCAVMHVLVV
jgi:hypothetical protein